MQSDRMWELLGRAQAAPLSRRSLLLRAGQAAGFAALGLAGPPAGPARARHPPR